jgi:hypothetical protein
VTDDGRDGHLDARKRHLSIAVVGRRVDPTSRVNAMRFASASIQLFSNI